MEQYGQDPVALLGVSAESIHRSSLLHDFQAGSGLDWSGKETICHSLQTQPNILYLLLH